MFTLIVRLVTSHTVVRGRGIEGRPGPAWDVAAGAGQQSVVAQEAEAAADGCVLGGGAAREDQRDALVERMLGEQARSMGDVAIESALMEVANIVASHVASGIADAVGLRLLPSVPMLAARDGAAQLEIVLREAGVVADRCTCELSDDCDELGGLLVLVSHSGAALR